MKNACVVLRKKNSATNENAFFAFINLFRLNGYPFDELHILPFDDNKRIEKQFSDLRGYDNLLILSEKSELSKMKEFFQNSFPHAMYQGGALGAGIYLSDKTTSFLLTVDDEKTGLLCAKEHCIPHLDKQRALRFGRYVIRTVGANKEYVESLMTETLRLSKEKAYCIRRREYAEDIVEIFYEQTIPKILLDDVIRLFVEGLGESIYALEDVSLEEQLVRLLKLRGKKLSVAESFTGGGVSSKITSVSGASEVFFEGVNTYDEKAKMKRLHVSKMTLQLQGAVSDQTAYEMAAGLIATGNCDVCISTTGLAGPKTDRSLLPVGLCYIGVGTKEKITIYRYQFEGNREEITKTAIQYALFLAYKLLKDI